MKIQITKVPGSKQQPPMQGQPQMHRYGGASQFPDGGKTGSAPMTQVFDENGKMSFVPDTGYGNTPANANPFAMGPYDPNFDPGIYKQGEGNFRFDQNPVDTPYTIPYVNDFTSSTTQQTSDDSGNTSGNKRAMPHFNAGALHNYVNPDTLGYITDAVRAASIPNYTPQRQIARGATPQTVFMDPARALAAIQENANATGYNIGLSGNGPVGRAIASQTQGQAGAQGADVVGKYANENTSIANKANQIAADVYNKLSEQQNMYNKDYDTEMANVYRDRYALQNTIQNDIQRRYQSQYQRQQQAHNYNYLNPYYTMDAQGFINPKTADQQRAYMAITNSGGMGTADGKNPHIEAEVAAGRITREQAQALYADEIKYRLHPNRESISWKNGQPQYRESGAEGSMGVNPYMPYTQQQKYGGKTGKKTKMRITAIP